MKREQILLYLLALINFNHIVDFMIMMPLGDVLMKLFEITPRQFSLVISSYTISAGISGFFSAFIIDRFDRKSALLFSSLGFALGTIACALATNYYTLLIARSVTGIFGGVVGGLVLAVVSDLFTYEKRGAAMGVVTAAFSLASVLGVPIGLFLAAKISWHAPFWMVGILGLLTTVAIQWIMPAMSHHFQYAGAKATPLEVLQNIVRDENQLYALLLTFIIVLGHFLVIPFFAPYLTRNIGFTQEEVTYIYLVGGACTIISSPLVGKATDKRGGVWVFTLLLFISFIPVIWITHMQPMPIPWVLFVSGLFFVFASGRMIPLQTMVSAVVSPAKRASFMSVRSSVQSLATALASIAAGLIVQETHDGTRSLQGYNYIGYLAILISLTTLIWIPRLKVAQGN